MPHRYYARPPTCTPKGPGEARPCVMLVLAPVSGRDDRIFAMLDHEISHTCCEGLHRSVKVSYNGITMTPSNETDTVSVVPGE